MASIYDPTRDRMVIFGGHPVFLGDLWTYGLSGSGAWAPLAAVGTPPSPRYGAIAVFDRPRDRMILFGGYDESQNFQNDVYELTFDGTPEWRLLTPDGDPPPVRAYAVGVYDSHFDRLVVFGGADATHFYGDVWTLSLRGQPRWRLHSPRGVSPPARDLSSGIYDPRRRRMVVFGGWSGFVHLDDTWELDLAPGTPSMAWRRIATAGSPGARRENSAIYDNDHSRMIVFGGFTGSDLSDPRGHLGDVWELPMSEGSEWRLVLPKTPPATGRFQHAAMFDRARRRMVVFGGYGVGPGGDLSYLDQTLELTLPMGATPEWHSLSYVAPSPRSDYSLAHDVAGRRAFLFSGTVAPYQDDRALWSLSFATDPPSWTEMTATGLSPHARHGHGSVWDPVRGRVLMFGGYDNETFRFSNQLWQLTPDPTPEWMNLTLCPCPAARLEHGMVYDPVVDRLLVFGGTPPFRNDLWSLPLSGPDAMHWRSVEALGTLPSPRWGFTWDYDAPRARMILFGGNTADGPVHDTWILDLNSDPPTWYPWVTINDPPARFVHASILDAQRHRLIVFGGVNSVYLSDTWELDLETGTWSQRSPQGTGPQARAVIHAAYDPPRDAMMFFGGFAGGPSNAYLGDTWLLGWQDPGLVPEEPLRRGVATAAKPAALRTELLSVGPNPGPGAIHISFSLGDAHPATMQLLDLAGRVRETREVGGSGLGTHSIRVGGDRRLEAGVYFVRFQSGDHRWVRKVSVIP